MGRKKSDMYCKHCGKQIADDSTFCQYCGGKVAPAVPNSTNQQDVSADSQEAFRMHNKEPQEVVIATNESRPIQVEISKKTTDNNSTIANEIVGNLKMVGMAAICWIIFMIGFIVYHQKDIKQFPDSNLGDSCYDGSVWFSSGSRNWEEILEKYKEYRANERNGRFPSGEPNPYADFLSLKKYDKSDEELERMAREEAQKNIDAFNEEINHHRQVRFEIDRTKKAKYSAIILLSFFIIGRYIVKLAKWTNKNKTY